MAGNITFNDVADTVEASGVFVEPQQVQRKITPSIQPQKILLIGQYDSSKSPTDDVPVLLDNANDAKTKYGRGSMLALMAEAAFKTCGAIPVYACPVADDGSGVDATGTITFATNASSSGTWPFYIGNKKVTVAVTTGDTPTEQGDALVAAVGADLDLPVTASNSSGAVTLTSKWPGASANGITIKKNLGRTDEAGNPGGTTATIVAMSSGANDPDISTALENFGDVQFTQLVIPYTDDTTYAAVATKGTELYGPSVKKPFMAYNGHVGTKSALTTLAGNRNSKFFSVFPVPGSASLNFVIGAQVAGAAARSAQQDPGRPGRGISLVGIGKPTEIWDYNDRNDMVKLGISTYKLASDDTVQIEDLCTTYTTENSIAVSTWRFVSTMTNIFNKIYQLDATFSLPPFDNCIVVDDASITAKPYAVRPKTALAYVIGLIDYWTEQAWTKDRDATVKGSSAEIDSSNPTRINVLVADTIAAGGRIMAVSYQWDFNPPSVD